MTGSSAEYTARAGMYKLLSTFLGPKFSETIDETLSDPALRDIISTLVGAAFAGYVRLADGDPQKAMEIIERECRTAEELRDL